MKLHYGLEELFVLRQRRRVVPFVTARTGLPADPGAGYAAADFHHVHRDFKVLLLYSLVRVLRPDRVVETGVCRGWSSRAILAALHDNGRGHLFSVDLPTLGNGRVNADGRWDGAHVGSEEETGREVPEYLRGRWTLRLGDSRYLLPDLLNDGHRPLTDLFFHDSEHTEAMMLWEYASAWAALRPGGILYSDDVHWTGAFARFAESVRGVARTFQVDRRGGTVGGVRK